ncbi:MAG: hypothetical protein PUC47_12230 [Oscillospiraceae bacterium]|nr:hypothetical protein [Oscillospiraceae bacterium]
MTKRGLLQITALLAALTVALTMVLGGCGKRSIGRGSWTLEEAAALFAGDFSSEAAITLGELEMTGTLTHSPEKTSLSLLTPEHLEGLCFTVGENGTEVTYKGLSVQAESMPVPGLGKAAAQLVTALGNPVLLQMGSTESGEPALSGRTENGAFTLTLGEDAPLLLEQPELQLTIRFTDFQAAEGGSPLPSESSGEGGTGSAGEGSAEQVSSAEEDVSSLQQGGE